MRLTVAPFAGAWIEIDNEDITQLRRRSLRSPERGLKYRLFKILILFSSVAPFAGAWIEIPANCTTGWNYNVAPFAGAWIEIH